MTGTSMVPRKRDGGPPPRRLLVDDELADQLLGKAQTLLTDVGAVDLAVPRDRNGTFEPLIVRKGADPAGGVQRARPGPPFPPTLKALTPRENEVLRLIARGLSNTEISSSLVIADQTE